jgi:hypothetical protein
MVVDERARLALHQRLEAVLGGEAAMTLMQHLPPDGWTQVATKSDLNALEARMEQRFDGMELRLGSLEQRMDRLDARMDRFEDRMNRFEDGMDRLGYRVGEQMKRLQGRMDGFHQELRSQTRVFIFAMLGAMATNTSIIVAAIRLQ